MSYLFVFFIKYRKEYTMKTKLNIFNVTLVAWIISLVITIVSLYISYTKISTTADTKTWVASVAFGIIIWFTFLLIIFDILKPIADHRLNKKITKKGMISLVIIFLSDIMMVISLIFIAFSSKNNYAVMLAFVLFSFCRTRMRSLFKLESTVIA